MTELVSRPFGALVVGRDLDQPFQIVESRHGGGRMAVEPEWLRFQTATGRKFVFAADLARTNVAGVRATALFACDAAQARCRRSAVAGGSGMYTTGVGIEPVTRAGSGVISS